MPELAAAARERGVQIDREISSEGDGANMVELARRLSLRPEHVELVWAVVACSIDARIVSHLEALGGAHARRGLSPAVYSMLAELDGDSGARLAHWLASPNPLVGDGLLVETEQVSPAARAYVASPRLVSFLLGEATSIEPLVTVRVPEGVLHDAAQSATMQRLADALERSARPLVVIEGPLGSGRVTACAKATGRELVVLDFSKLAMDRMRDSLLALRREGSLRTILPVLANVDYALGDDREPRRVIGAFIDSIDGPIVATSTVPGVDLGTSRAIARITWDVPETGLRTALWTSALESIGAPMKGDLTSLAHRYRVGPAAIRRAVESLQILHPAGTPLGDVELARGLRHNIAERLGGLATRVEINQTWDDLVIADDIRDLISALIGRIRHAQQVLDRWGYRRKIARGAGVPALFSGPPGTGKTMVAGLIARELDLEMYQVDLSKVTSKWVGETEKNLARVFDAADEGHGLLLFDEADALFGQRTSDVKGANDRYANLEVNYLLQRVEAFGGITILTTNLETAIDTALKRRLASHVVFATPDEDERARLWQRQTTTGSAPIDDDVDHQELSQLFPKMSGANIRNAAISAAFLAAADHAPKITQDYLIRAARAEYRAMGHMISDTVASRGQPQRSL
ncbi:MAG: ATPase central domain protein [Myxococcales bacterium]|nr:ATPase central domain protein [Myxococcales bacterium]